MKRYIIALDEGTTSARAAIFDLEEHAFIKIVNAPFDQIYPQAGWVEHDLNQLYAAQIAALNDAVILSGINPSEILSIAITNQRETVAAWNSDTGKPVCNAIVWQCRRTADACDELKKNGYDEIIVQKTGLLPDAYFSATKIQWIIKNVPEAKKLLDEGKLRVGTIDSYLIWRLTNGKSFVTDYTNASRTMLFNIHSLSWDDELLALFGVPKEILPKVIACDEIAGTTTVLGKEIPVCGVAGDQQAALFGQGCFTEGSAKNTYGTGCFLLMNTGSKPITSKEGLLTTVGFVLKDRVNYALEGSIFNAGSAVQWLRDEMQILKKASDSERYSNTVPDTGGVYVVPAFTGLGAPYWDMDARGTIVGITRGTNKYHIVRAVIESMAYSTVDVLNAMKKDGGLSLSVLSCDGGASGNNFLMQFQADMLNVSTIRPKCVESTALGAVYLSALGMGAFKSVDDITSCIKRDRVFTPSMSEEDRIQKYAGWKEAVKRSLHWA
ncbi:MAG: glycerol kinase GlpK [Clostridia bacterium]|nr:glycerol kinase GlpK [Clostridia bacterium]